MTPPIDADPAVGAGPGPADTAGTSAGPAGPGGAAADPERTDWFTWDLPEGRIAQDPIEPRDAARLLVDLGGPDERPEVAHRHVRDLPELVGPGDVVVVNDTRVIPARLLAQRSTGGKVEILLLEPTGRPRQWQALVGSGRRVAPGTEVYHEGEPLALVGEALGDGRRLVELLTDDAVDRAGHIPLPPYIHHPLADAERYQTVFARHPGSVAAPTAGLHLTPAVLAGIEAAGARLVRVELRVGLGTFRPVTAERVADHDMHGERYRISPEAWSAIGGADRVVAVGTTVVRTLETAAATSELEGVSHLFIRRGFPWRVVDTLLTNFHVPRSSLLVLLDAFIGPRWKALYQAALAHHDAQGGYRFLSFGDAMWVERRAEPTVPTEPTVPAAPGGGGR